MDDLPQSEINLNCANSTMAGNLGMFFAKITGEHHDAGEVIETKAMVYVIEGDIVLVSSRQYWRSWGAFESTSQGLGSF